MEKKLFFEDEFIYIEREINDLPWVKIFTKCGSREISECDGNTRKRLFDAMLICERVMLEYYKPTKINIASFANYLPRVHIHVIARFENDDFFPQSVWGVRQRNSVLTLPSFDEFSKKLIKSLQN